ncbi:MAG: amino acid adenylation domain-containing protein, partial [Bacteroidota bacterium]
MSKALNIIKKAQQQGVKLELEDGSLVVKSENEEIDDALLFDLKRNKELIVEYLSKYDQADPSYQRLSKDAIKPFDREEVQKVPLSFSQERLWFLDQLQGSVEYHLPFALRLSGELNKPALISSLREVVNRHEVLRTIIYSEEGIGYQKILNADKWDLTFKDLKADSANFNEDLKSFLSAPFDLGSDYMFRSCLYDLEVTEDGVKEYVLAGVFHHISSDGWSQGILISEFMELYHANVSGRAASLSSLPLQYADYAVWQRTNLEGTVIERELNYWQETLDGVNTLQLPTDFVRPAEQSFAGATTSFELSNQLFSGVQSLTQSEGTTVFMTLLTAFKVLLSRYSGQEDICVGTPVANRIQKEMEGMIGCFVNTLALRSQVNEESTFLELLQEVKRTTLSAYDHQQVPFEKVVQRVVKTRDMSNSPVFQVMFILQNTPGSNAIEMDGLTLSEYEDQESGTSKFDITFTVNETDSGASVDINYCTDLFREETIHRIFAHFKELLKAVLAAPSRPLCKLSMLKEEEKHQLLVEFNDTAAPYPERKTVVDLIEEQTAKTPDAVAVTFGNETLTYKQLNERSNQLANYLVSKGVTNDGLVAICLDRSPIMLVAILGTLKSGGAFIPIDPEFPQSRIDYMLEDSGAKVMLSSRDLAEKFADQEQLDVISLDQGWNEQIGNLPIEDLNVGVSSEHLAYVIYTSGSTGKPKGVPIAHASLFNFLLAVLDRLEMKKLEVFLSVTTYTFDIFYLELFTPLLTGAKLIVLDSMSIKDGQKLQDAIATHQPDFMQATPSTWQMLVDNGWQNREGVTVLTGGEAINESLKNSLTGISDTVWNLYGPTEATIWVTAQQLRRTERVNIGKPINNVQLFILDWHDAILPIGVAGELCIGGIQVSDGYLNREELTREKFIAHPFESGKRLYKTGDLARRLPDGSIELIGRMDSQVKVRGYRIELGEIENNLSLIEGVQEACVMASEDESGTNRLIGYIVTADEINTTTWKEDMQSQLLKSLPEYMVPKLWVFMEEMPRTANGKLDRKALPDLDSTALSAKEYVAPRNQLETQLVNIWQDLLGVKQIGVYDNFFELGGHSLLATRLVATIRDETAVELTVRDVFTYTDINSLGSYLSQQQHGTLLPRIERVAERPDYIPLSFSQERLWFIDQLQGSLEYHMPFALRISGDLDIDALTKSLQGVVDRHQVLRTVIYSADGVGYQKLLSADHWELSQKDLSNDKTLLGEDSKSFLLQPFDLSADFMFRSRLYYLGTNTKGDHEYVLAGVFHHISSDGWSQGILVREFLQLYSTHVAGQKFNSSDLPLQYADYALWQRNHLEGVVLENQLAYWENKLEGVSALQLPTDHARPAIQSVAGSTISFELNKAITTEVNELSQKEGVTPFMTLLATFKVLMSKYSGQEDICLGTPIANRTQKELEEMIGFFVNTLALRTQVHRESSFLELLQSVKQTTLDAYDHQQVPFEKVVERVVKTRDMSRSPLFQVMFVLQNTPESTQIEMDGLTISDYEADDQVTSKFDLTIHIEEHSKDSNAGLTVDISYCTDLYNESTIRRLFAHYQELIEAVVATPSKQIGELPIIRREEKRQLLEVFNDTDMSYPSDKSVVDLFELQVAKTPEATAVVCEKVSLTYQELDERSNQLAHFLKGKGVIAEEMIGICLERSAEMIIGILGILKAGGAYVPIDPAYPDSRINFMIKDAAIRRFLTKNDVVQHIASLELAEDGLILLDESTTQLKDIPVSSAAVNLSANQLAYVIYTSGSTGQPKGVQVEHRSIVSLASSCDYVRLNSETTWLSTGSISFDATTIEYWGTLLNGGRLVLANNDTLLNNASLKALIREKDINTIWMTASWFHQVVSDDLSVFEPLNYLLVGGDIVLPNYTNQVREQYPGLTIVNGYGPTENTTFSTTHPIEIAQGVLPIGKPIKNSSAYILDESMQLLPVGVVGELVVGGSGVARGYLNNTELTNKKFFVNPFKAGDRLYKTGDLAKWLPDGTIELAGRSDDQVKISGYRIELGEIENTMSQLTEVIQCCVLAKVNENGQKRLVAYVVLENELDKEAIQASLGENLPDYMIPRLWMVLDEMPLTSNGKIDKKALPELDGSALSSNEYVAPRTELETLLVEIWQDLLGIEKIGVYDNFFELGGYSLLAVRLIARIQEIGYDTTIRNIFTYPNIAELSSQLSAVTDAYQIPVNGIEEGCKYITPSMVTLVDLSQEELEKIMDHVSDSQHPGGATNIQDIYPLSPLQQGIYFNHLMSDRKNGDPYVLPNLISFTSEQKRSEFIDGLRFVIRRHDVFRTLILSAGFSQAIQVVLRDIDLPVEELTLDTSREILPQIEKEIAPESLWVDPSQAPLMQVKVADDEANGVYYLVYNYHHLMMDHIGLEKVQQEVVLYLSGQEELLPKPSLYRNFIGDTLNEEKLKESQKYFSALYHDVETPTYPYNLSDIDVDGTTRIVKSREMLSSELRDKVRKVSGDLQMSPAVFFYAAFGLVVGRCSSAEHALFGTVLLGRLQGSEGSESSLGLFMNTLPVLLNLKGNVADYISQTNEHLQNLMAYEQTPSADIHDWSGISNDMPLFSALLNYRHSNQDIPVETDYDLGAKHVAGGSRNNFPFNFDVDDLGDDFLLTAKISDVGVDPFAVLSYMKESLTLLLENISQNSKASGLDLRNLSILPESEKQRLLSEFNNTIVSLSSTTGETIVNLFAAQVGKSPDSTAIIFEGKKLSYQELDIRSNQLARHLVSKGISQDDLVGICIDRSLEMIISIWGILKSGGAYVPIDPEYPQDRKDYMLEDSGVKILLSDLQNESEFSTKGGLEVISLDRDWDKIANESAESPGSIASSDNLAYIIYTSGSTGKPKGVKITHSCLTDYFHGLLEKTNIQSCNSFGLSSSIATDLGNTVLFPSLLTGGTLYVLSEDELISAEKMSALSIDCLKMVPSHWKTLQTKEAIFVPNKCLILGGEAFTDDVLDMLITHDVSCEVYNHYGPTETTIGKLIHQVSLAEKLNHSVPLGVPFGQNRVYVLDANDHLCPTGVAGELCIGGAGLAKGYLNRASLTSEKFVSDPFIIGERIYKTGDLARWLPSGRIEFIGRKDNQIKIRGYRVELGEIENALTSISGITSGCVLATEDDHGDKRLVGYVVTEDQLDKLALQEKLQVSLPEYMVPQMWVELDEMPLTNNGKIDRKSLPEPDSEGLSSKEYVAPRSEAEQQLVEIWQDLLGVEQVGIYDNFFELGGQSLLAIRLIARIQKLGYTVNIKDFYADPSIALLSTKLANVDSGYQVPKNGIIAGCTHLTPAMVTLADVSQEELERIMDQVPEGAANIQDIYPLSPLQEGIYFHHLVSDPDHGDPYALPRLLSFKSVENRSKFLEALTFVIGRHDVLRTCVLSEGLSQALQVVLRVVDLPIEELQLDSSQAILPQLEEEIAPENLYMDLTTAPMLKAKIADDEANEAFYLVLHHHHLMMDHIGMAKVVEEVICYLSGQAESLPKPSLYRDFIGNTLNKEKIAESK